MLLVTKGSVLRAIFCSCFHFHKEKLYLKGAVGMAKVVLKTEVYQSFKMKPMNYIVALSTIISHLGSEVEVFDCLIKYEIESPISFASSKSQQKYLILCCCKMLCS